MLIINKETVDQVKSKILSPETRGESIQDIRRMLEIKETLLWRAEAGVCCSGDAYPELYKVLTQEIDIFGKTLAALEKGEYAKAVAYLEEYSRLLDTDHSRCYSNYCQS